MTNFEEFELKSQLDFKSQKIQIDFLAFEFSESNFDRELLIQYFIELGFNAFDHYGNNRLKGWVELEIKKNNKYQIVFQKPNFLREWRLLHFSSRHARRFYDLVKQDRIDWRIFHGAKLTRLDTVYIHSIKSTDPAIADFFLEIHKRTNKNTDRKNKIMKCEYTPDGSGIYLGNRRHINYLRIYKEEKTNNLRFEHEFKSKAKLRTFFNLLKSKQFQQFERRSILQLSLQCAQKLPYSYCFTDWVYFIIRPISTQLFRKNISDPGFYYQTDYMISETNKIVTVKLFNQYGEHFEHIVDNLQILQFLRFLEFLRNLQFEVDKLSHNNLVAKYRVYVFELRTFLESSSNCNSYQMSKLKKFIEMLQTQAILQFFHNKSFKSIALIPFANVDQLNKVGAPLIATIWIAEEIFYYDFPFILPDFSTKRTKLSMIVGAYWTQQFAVKDIQKIFNLVDFFNNYPAKLNYKQKQRMKRELLRAVKYYSERQLIDQKFKIIQGEEFKLVLELTESNISEGFVIYEKVNIDINPFYS